MGKAAIQQMTAKRPSLAQMRRLLPLEQSPRSHNQTIVYPMTGIVTPISIIELKTFSIPNAAPANAIVAAPAPINFARTLQSCSFQGRSLPMTGFRDRFRSRNTFRAFRTWNTPGGLPITPGEKSLRSPFGDILRKVIRYSGIHIHIQGNLSK